MTDLGGLHKRLFHSDAQDVNNQGQIVGHSQEMVQTIWGSGGRKGYEAIGDSRVFLFDGEMQALDTLVADMAGFTTLERGSAIAVAGFIVGYGNLNHNNGDRDAFIAVPIALAGSAPSSLLVAASESTAASFVSLVSREASGDDVATVSAPLPTTATASDDGATIVSVAARLPAVATVSRSSTRSEPVTATADDTVDQARAKAELAADGI